MLSACGMVSSCVIYPPFPDEDQCINTWEHVALYIMYATMAMDACMAISTHLMLYAARDIELLTWLAACRSPYTRITI